MKPAYPFGLIAIAAVSACGGSVSYPSYQTTTTNLSWLAAIEGLPTTIFINPAGKVAYVHTGQYDAQGTPDQDISSYASGG